MRKTKRFDIHARIMTRALRGHYFAFFRFLLKKRNSLAGMPEIGKLSVN